MLAGCGVANDGPSQDDMRDAFGRAGAKVSSVERIACKAAPDRPGYICDYKAVSCRPYSGACGASQYRTGRFVEVQGSWMFMGDMAGATPVPSPPDAAPAASPPTSTPTPTPTPSPSPSPSPPATATPLPSPSSSPTPRPSPTPNPAAVTRLWLIGLWDRDADRCDDEEYSLFLHFHADGQFDGRRGMGRWRLSGSTVYVTSKQYEDSEMPAYQTLAIERITRDIMTVEGTRYYRCR